MLYFVLVRFHNFVFLAWLVMGLMFIMFVFDKYVQFNAVFGLLVDHQDMHLSSLMIGGMHLMLFMPWTEKMVGVLSFLTILRVVEAVVGVGVEVMT